MLLDKKYDLEEGTVYGLRSPAIGEVIAKVVSVNDTEVVVQQPLQLVQAGDGNVGLAPAIPFSDDSKPIVMPRKGLLYYHVSDDTKSSYTSATTGLVVPSQGIKT